MREWSPPGMPPSRHFSYAIQWWGFAGCAARALLRPQFSQGVLMQDSRARGRRTLLIVAADVPAAGGGGVHAVLRQALASRGFLEQGRAHRPGAAARPWRACAMRTARPPAPDVLAGKWTLLYIGDGRCDEACRTALVFGRQTRLALNNEMTRVQRVFLATGNCCDTDYFAREQAGPRSRSMPPSPEAAALLAQFPGGARAHAVHRRSARQSHDAPRRQPHHQGPAERSQEAAQAVAHRLRRSDTCAK